MGKLLFDRRTDISKIDGYTAAAVVWRWEVFREALQDMPQSAAVLDFGCGSLRETFDLHSRGFKVTAVDIDNERLMEFARHYKWGSNPPEIIGTGMRPLATVLRDRQFDLICAFDVIEHLENPSLVVSDLRALLKEDGMMMVIVPNSRSLSEQMMRISFRISLALKRPLQPGAPHLYSWPTERWVEFFESIGLRVFRHQMTMGFFCETYTALVLIPARAIDKLVARLGAPKFLERFLTPLVPSLWRHLDQMTEELLQRWWGSNIFLLRKMVRSGSPTADAGALGR